MRLARNKLSDALYNAIDMMLVQDIMKARAERQRIGAIDNDIAQNRIEIPVADWPRVHLVPEDEPDPYKTIADGLRENGATIDAGGP